MNNLPNTNIERLAAWRKAHPCETPQQVINRLEAERTELRRVYTGNGDDTTSQRLAEIEQAVVSTWDIQRLWRVYAGQQTTHSAWEQRR